MSLKLSVFIVVQEITLVETLSIVGLLEMVKAEEMENESGCLQYC